MIGAWLDLVHGTECVGCPAPGRSLCPACAARLPGRAVPVRPTPCPEGLAACFAAGEYADLLRALVVAHKEQAAYSLVGPLGRLLAVACEPALDGTGPVVLTPVPSRPAVVRARGQDPVLRIARVGARLLRARGHDVRVARLLEQHGVVLDQAGLDAAGRARNRAGSMVVRPAARAALARGGVPLSVLLVDDVLTTGATAREGQRALEVTGLPVRAVVTVAATSRRFAARADDAPGPPAGALPL